MTEVMETVKIVPNGGAPATAADPRPAPDTDAGLETWTVPLAQIDAEGSPFRFRRTIRADALIRQLAASIEAQGLLHPLTVRRKGELFELVSGFRRQAALAFLARTKGIAPLAYPVKVSVLPDRTSDDEALAVSFAENLARKSLDATEKAIAFVKLRDEFGKTQEEIVALVRLGRTQLQKMLEVLAAPQDVREAFRAGRLGLKHALVLARIQDPAAREAVIRRAGVKALRVEAIAAAGEPGRAPEEAEEPAAEPLLPEPVRPFVRLARKVDPIFPFRLVVRLKTEEAVARVARYLLRFA
ncbi:MAG TPA: ParB/RepB/Spo0J family partition protein [Planctomycetota bacterium]|jgi:ParB family chromosome partitioning protein|nr:ParB/RepB/Spo0J family partition protein [Planctomycetota bacterium]